VLPHGCFPKTAGFAATIANSTRARVGSPPHHPLDLAPCSRCSVTTVNISQLADRAGVATSTVRFYERTGVLPGASRRAPLTIEVLAEVGIDWRAARSRSLTEVDTRSLDYLVTVRDRARLACPPLPGVRDVLHWGIGDPTEVGGTPDEQREAFRRARDELASPDRSLR
jgi:hypothetical protein